MRQMIITLVGEYIGETNEDKRNPELCPNEEKSWEVMSTQFSDVTTSQEPSHCCQFGLLLFTLCFILPRQWWYILWSDEVLSARPTLCKNRVDVFALRDSDKMSELDDNIIITYLKNVWKLHERSTNLRCINWKQGSNYSFFL